MDRRQFVKLLGSAPFVSCKPSPPVAPLNSSQPIRFPKPIGSPVLESIRPVIEDSHHVQTHLEKIAEVAGWMAYEDLPMPDFFLPFGIGQDAAEAIDFIMVSDSIDFAFTDFTSHVKFQVDFAGKRWSDSEALFACLKRAQEEGIPILDGSFLARLKRSDLERIFRGNIELPLLDERAEILNAVGRTLENHYGGHFHNFVRAASPRLYDRGRGLIEMLTHEFPRFNDVYEFEGHEVKIYKLAQLGVWMMYVLLHSSRGFELQDPEKLTALADYIIPAALRVLGIFSYSPELEDAIRQYRIIARGSRQEIEIRAHTLYATALLREEVNKLRPPDLEVIIPQIDARLWTHYHTTFWPHHLTPTIMY